MDTRLIEDILDGSDVQTGSGGISEVYAHIHTSFPLGYAWPAGHSTMDIYSGLGR